MTWMKASTTPLATWVSGRVNVSVGSRMENFGNVSGLMTEYFECWYVTTAPMFISEPVAGRVSTTPNGTACFTTGGVMGLKPNFSRSVGSPS